MNTGDRDYLDNVLISLKRKYSKDDTVAALIKKLSESEVKNGQLQSFIDEKKYQNKGEELRMIDDLIKKNKDLVSEVRELKIENRKIVEGKVTETTKRYRANLRKDFGNKIKKYQRKITEMLEVNKRRKERIKELEDYIENLVNH